MKRIATQPGANRLMARFYQPKRIATQPRSEHVNGVILSSPFNLQSSIGNLLTN